MEREKYIITVDNSALMSKKDYQRQMKLTGTLKIKKIIIDKAWHKFAIK